jgi:hypothetical protein
MFRLSSQTANNLKLAVGVFWLADKTAVCRLVMRLWLSARQIALLVWVIMVLLLAPITLLSLLGIEA